MIPLDFNAVVGQAIEDHIGLGNKVAVIEKEILHYDILRTLHDGGYLEHLVFKGGTCLRLCFGGARFSEDLDFSGGADFDPARLAGLEDALRYHIGTHYGLQVFVAPPKLDGTTVRPIMRWVVRIVTQARLRNAPSQRIKIEIDRHRVARVAHLPLVLNYAHLAESYALFPIRVAQLEEVLTDKLIAFPMSVRERQHPRYRDIWDLRWLVDHRKVALNAELLMDKAMHRGGAGGCGGAVHDAGSPARCGFVRGISERNAPLPARGNLAGDHRAPAVLRGVRDPTTSTARNRSRKHEKRALTGVRHAASRIIESGIPKSSQIPIRRLIEKCEIPV